jgi:hypothetical protein
LRLSAKRGDVSEESEPIPIVPPRCYNSVIWEILLHPANTSSQSPILLSPELSLDQMAELGARASDFDELSGERVKEEVKRCIAESQSLSTPSGDLPASWKTGEFEKAQKALHESLS